MTANNLAVVFAPTFFNGSSPGAVFQDMNVEFKVMDLIISNCDTMFGVEDMNARDASFRSGMKRLDDLKRSSMHSIKAASLIVTVLTETSSEGVSVALHPNITGREARQLALQLHVDKGSKLPQSSNWVIFEDLEKGDLLRPIDDQELIVDTIMKWTTAGQLRLRRYPQKQLLLPKRSALRGWMQARTKRGWKPFFGVFTPGSAVLNLFKDDKEAGEPSVVPVLGARVYLVENMRKAPHRFCCCVYSGVPGLDGDACTALSIEAEADFEEWVAQLIVGAHPERFEDEPPEGRP
jgi:hypothetical protein